MSHYNPGGWSGSKVKAYGILLAVALAAFAIGAAMGWIDLGNRGQGAEPQNLPVQQLR